MSLPIGATSQVWRSWPATRRTSRSRCPPATGWRCHLAAGVKAKGRLSMASRTSVMWLSERRLTHLPCVPCRKHLGILTRLSRLEDTTEAGCEPSQRVGLLHARVQIVQRVALRPDIAAADGGRTNVCRARRCADQVDKPCTTGKEPPAVVRSGWEHEHLLEAVQRRLDENPDKMRQRRETVEHPFGTIKMWMGATHFLMKRLKNRPHRDGAECARLQSHPGHEHHRHPPADGGDPGVRAVTPAV